MRSTDKNGFAFGAGAVRSFHSSMPLSSISLLVEVISTDKDPFDLES